VVRDSTRARTTGSECRLRARRRCALLHTTESRTASDHQDEQPALARSATSDLPMFVITSNCRRAGRPMQHKRSMQARSAGARPRALLRA
jgi:hypothetical protein